MAPHSSTLAWKIPWVEETNRLQSMGSLTVGHDWETSLSLSTFMNWRRKWQSTPVLAWRIPGTAEPSGLPSMGSHRIGHDWSDLAAAATAAGIMLFKVDLFFHRWFYGFVDPAPTGGLHFLSPPDYSPSASPLLQLLVIWWSLERVPLCSNLLAF